MIIKNGKTNWLHISIVAVFAITAIGVVLFLQYNFSKELETLKTPTIQKPILKPAPKSISMPTEIDQNFLTQVNECFIPTAKVYGYALRITSSFRSLTEQDAIYDSGRTEDGHIVSWATPGKSIHNYGFAVDVVDRWRGYYVNWKKLARIGEFCGLEQVDDAHFEHRGGLTTEQFSVGERPSSLSLPCDIMNERAKNNQPLTFQDLEDCGVSKF